ncbi:high mobility group protein B3 [Halyomorpha halys]|uniref:high mobility group protein B3 n=1 Tax=Halyomorpha halys TaxID=286706 RepID=UPI0006D4FDF4|nr:high mobility group protein B3 [Halyomorpha halys]
MGKRKSPTNESDSKKKYKRPPSAYSLFVKSAWEKEGKKDSFSTFTKGCGALWAKMTDDEKKKFKDEASVLKEQWDGNKDPKKKRTPGPYIMFCSDMRAKIKKENPEFSMTQISKELGRLWNELTDEEKAKYQQKATEEKEKNYDEEEGKSEIEEKLKKKKEKSGGKVTKVPVSS